MVQVAKLMVLLFIFPLFSTVILRLSVCACRRWFQNKTLANPFYNSRQFDLYCRQTHSLLPPLLFFAAQAPAHNLKSNLALFRLSQQRQLCLNCTKENRQILELKKSSQNYNCFVQVCVKRIQDWRYFYGIKTIKVFFI